MQEQRNWRSRKLLLSIFQWGTLVCLPIVYKEMGISESTLLVVLGGTTSIISLYLGVNLAQKKIQGGEQ